MVFLIKLQGGKTLQIISHEVKDVDEWLSFNKERVKTFSKFAENIFDFVDSENSNYVSVCFNVLDVEEMDKVLGSEEVRNEAEKHGVVFDTLKRFIQK